MPWPGVAPVVQALVAAAADIATAMTSASATVSFLPG